MHLLTIFKLVRLDRPRKNSSYSLLKLLLTAATNTHESSPTNS